MSKNFENNFVSGDDEPKSDIEHIISAEEEAELEKTSFEELNKELEEQEDENSEGAKRDDLQKAS